MSALDNTSPTLLDLTKRLDPDGSIATIAELLTETNEILNYLPWVEGNLPTGHRSTVRTGLPEPTWRKLYGFVQPSKSTTAQITDSCGMLEAYAEVDKALADLNGNTAAFRLSEDRAHIEGMNQAFASTLFYGNESTKPEAFTGLAPRFNDQAAENGGNIITHAATPDNNDNTSMWLIVAGPNTVHGIYPKGSKGGLQFADKGQVTVESSEGRMEAYRSHYRWDCGLVVRDWRYVVRINFDLEDVDEISATYTGPRLHNMMRKALRRVPSLSMGRPFFVANRDALDALDLQSANNPTLAFKTIEDSQGKLIDTFMRVPVIRCDAINSTEAGI